MASAEDYANWIVKNADKKGTPEFDTVSKAYQQARGTPNTYDEATIAAQGAAKQSEGVNPDGSIPGFKGTLDPTKAGDNWSSIGTAENGLNLTRVVPGRGLIAKDPAAFLGAQFQRTGQNYGGAFETPQAGAEFMQRAQAPPPPPPDPQMNLMDPTRPDIVPGQSYHARVGAGFADQAQAERDKAIAALGPDAQMNALPGVLTGAASQLGGIGGEVGNLVSAIPDVAGYPGVAQGIRDINPFPNMDQFGDIIAGPAENDLVTAYRKAGQIIGPGPLMKGALKGVAKFTGWGQGKPIEAAVKAHNANYILSSRMVTKGEQSAEGQLSGAASGKVKSNQYLSLKNQPNTNRLAAQDIELPSDTRLTREVITGQRAKFAADKQAIVDSLPQVATDDEFKAAVNAVGGREGAAAKRFKNIVRQPKVEELANDPDLQADSWTPQEAAGLVVSLRDQASSNLKTIGPGAAAEHTKGLAQKQLADAMDDLIARNLISEAEKTGDHYHGAAQAAHYKKSRELMAKTYDIEDTTDFTTGDVNAHAIHRISKTRPLTGNLATIAETAGNFRGATQPAQMIGGMEHASVLDYYLIAHAVGTGDVGTGAAVAGRMAARPFIASKYNQERIMQRPIGPVPLPGHPYTFAPYQAQVQAGADAARGIPKSTLGLRHAPPTLNALNLYLGTGPQ